MQYSKWIDSRGDYKGLRYVKGILVCKLCDKETFSKRLFDSVRNCKVYSIFVMLDG